MNNNRRKLPNRIVGVQRCSSMLEQRILQGKRALLASAACAIAAAAGLVDNPIIADTVQYLDGAAWTVSNGTSVFPARVPGDLLTDLQLNGVIGDPLYELTFQETLWDTVNYTYSVTFDSANFAGSMSLVFDGIKMVGDISLNGAYLGFAADQFVRYVFDVTAVLKMSGNVLTVTFPPGGNDTRNAEGRWMACSGGWDWAPYSSTHSSSGISTFSKGIWKSVYLISVASTALQHIVPHVYYNGSYPMAPLTDATAGPFTVAVRVHFSSPAAVSGNLKVCGGWGGACNASLVSLPAGDANATLTLTVAAGSVNLWWPAGMGSQPLYNVTASFTPTSGATLSGSRAIGFRVFTLVTGNDTDPSTLAGKDGSDEFTMRFKVNGANIWSRGGNQIPMEEMEGRQNAAAYAFMLQSAVDAGMNTLRLWGGGIFMPDIFYDTADALGLLIYHDMMYAQSHFPNASSAQQDAEIRHQVRRLSHHPSIVIFDSCNECGGHGIYASFVATTVVQEDTSRPPWPSCPSSGWTSGVDRLWSLPNGSPMGLQPRATPPDAIRRTHPPRARAVIEASAAANCTFVPNVDFSRGLNGPNFPSTSPADCCNLCRASPDTCYAAVFSYEVCWFKNSTMVLKPGYSWGAFACMPDNHTFPPLPPPSPPKYSMETHGPYQHGNGWNTKNSPAELTVFYPNVPPVLGPSVPTGTGWWGNYASEFGGVAPSSFESFQSTLAETDWGIHAKPMWARNYAMDNFIVTYFGTELNRNATGEASFKAQLYLALVGQALEMKSDITMRRSENSFGTITWQLNEIWPTGGWGSIEYGTVGFTDGQVIGGRWKPLQYFMRRSLYRNVFAACGEDGRCFVKNDDALNPFDGTLTLSFLHVTTGIISAFNSTSVSLPLGAGVTTWMCMGGGNAYNMSCDAPSVSLAAAGCASNGADCILLLNVTDAVSGASVCDNFELQAVPSDMNLTAANIAVDVGAVAPDGTVPIGLTSDATALFVTLTTLAQGRFDDNAVFVTPSAPGRVTFVPFGSLNMTLLTSTLRAEHVGQYI